MITTPTRPPSKAHSFAVGCFVQFIGIKWPAKVARPPVVSGHRVLNTPWRQFLSMVLAAVRGLHFVGCPGVARLGPLGLTLSPPPKGMPKEGFHV